MRMPSTRLTHSPDVSHWLTHRAEERGRTKSLQLRPCASLGRFLFVSQCRAQPSDDRIFRVLLRGSIWREALRLRLPIITPRVQCYGKAFIATGSPIGAGQ